MREDLKSETKKLEEKELSNIKKQIQTGIMRLGKKFGTMMKVKNQNKKNL